MRNINNLLNTKASCGNSAKKISTTNSTNQMFHSEVTQGSQNYFIDHKNSVRLNKKLLISISVISIIYFIIDICYYLIQDKDDEISYPVLMCAIGFQLLRIIVSIFFFKFGSKNSVRKFSLLERILVIVFVCATIASWNLQLTLDETRAYIVGVDAGWTFLYINILFTNFLGKLFIYISITIFGVVRTALFVRKFHFGFLQSGFQLVLVVLTLYLIESLKKEVFWRGKSLEQTHETFRTILDNLPENIAIINLQGEMTFYNSFLDLSFKVSKSANKSQFFSQIVQVKPRERHFDLEAIQERFQMSNNTNKLPNPSAKKMKLPRNRKSIFANRKPSDKSLRTEETIITRNRDSFALGPKEKKTESKTNLAKPSSQAPLSKSLTEVLLSRNSFDNLQETVEFFCKNAEVLKRYTARDKSFFLLDGKYETTTGSEKSYEIKISLSNFDLEECLIVILKDTTYRDILVTLEDNNRFIDGVLSSISHELRTPLNTNLNLIELAIKQEFCNHPKAEFIDPAQTNINDHSHVEANENSIANNIKQSLLIPAHQSGKLLESIINDILDYSMLLGRKLMMNIKEKYLLKSLDKVRYMCEFQARKKNLEFHISLSQKLNHLIATDHRRIRQILTNILNNAIRFTNKGHILLKVEPYGESSSIIKFSVKDTGIGMDQTSLRSLIKNLSRGRALNKLNKDANGIGMGLTISNLLARELGPTNGRASGIKIESTFNEGSTFWFLVEDCNKAIEVLVPQPDAIRRSKSEFELSHYSQFSKCSTGGLKLFEMKSTPHISSPTAQQNAHHEYNKFKDSLNVHVANTNEAILTKDDLMDEEIACMIKDDNLKVNSIQTKLLNKEIKPQNSPVSNILRSRIEEKFFDQQQLLKPTRRKSEVLVLQVPYSLNSSNLKTSFDDIQIKTPAEEKDEAQRLCYCPEILVVDDDAFNLFTMESLLNSLGLKMCKAMHGEEAISRVLKRREFPCSSHCTSFKLIFMDLSMPVMDGFEATKKLKELMNAGQISEIPIIACTAFVDNEKTKKCLECGMLGKISKPVTQNKLKEVLVKHDVLVDED